MVTLVLERVKEVERKNRERLYDESEDVRRSREGRCTRDSVKPDVELRTKKCTRNIKSGTLVRPTKFDGSE